MTTKTATTATPTVTAAPAGSIHDAAGRALAARLVAGVPITPQWLSAFGDAMREDGAKADPGSLLMRAGEIAKAREASDWAKIAKAAPVSTLASGGASTAHAATKPAQEPEPRAFTADELAARVNRMNRRT